METAIGAAAGLGVDLLSTDWKYKKQLEQQQKMQAMQIAGQKEMGAYNAELQKQLGLDMWNATNAEAQRKHYENAGLNVGLMYGKGGTGGTTVGSAPGSVSGGGAGTPEVGMGMQLGLQTAQAKANMELTKAQTENVKADTVKKTGVDTQKTETEIGKIAQETENAAIQGEILQYEKVISSVKAHIDKITVPDAIAQMAKQTDILVGKAKQELNEGRLVEATYNQMITQIEQTTIQQAAQIIALKEGIEWQYGTTAQVERWTNMATKAVGAMMPGIRLGVETRGKGKE